MLQVCVYLEDIIQHNMAEAFACSTEDTVSFFHLVLLISGSLSVLDQRCLLLLTHFIKLLLRLLKLPQVPENHTHKKLTQHSPAISIL